ncbi:cobyrinate a,c-diamide synthase [Actinoplanes sp. HUAS TT8]|uniref:cobyrinate a,c-diamide synthase n=1 Tax=Actinoplanes sp. HUAS TT8 TaxID=3447453 RepID=UPI003F51CCF6
MSAPSSGHGKTAIAVGLLAAMAARGVTTAGFKVGPDHTDAAYLGLAAGRPGRNLDPRLVGAQRIAPLFGHGASGAQLSVIEGAMGLFDSLTGQPEIDGTAAVAAALRAPVALVVDVAAMGHSLAALVHGFRMFDEMVHLGGVILNRVASPRHEQMLRSALDDIGMPVLGALRRGDLPNVLPSRAHGLVPVAHRTVEAGRAVRRLGEAVAQALDLDRLMALANTAPSLPGPFWTPAEAGEPVEMRPVVALAGGPGAPYTYVETAELLSAAGAEVVIVDPLRDESLPPGTRALIVGSGLPEGYAEELSANRRLCADVAQFARDGWPVVAEGVALPWLGRELDGRPMCGVLDITGVTGEQTVAGYREATAPGTSVLAPAGARITGYKQHRAVVTPRAGSAPAWTWSGGNPEGFVWRQVHASQLGLHWAAAPEIAKRLVLAAVAGPAMPGQQPPMSAPAPQAPMAQPIPMVQPVSQLAQPLPAQLVQPVAAQLAQPVPSQAAQPMAAQHAPSHPEPSFEQHAPLPYEQHAPGPFDQHGPASFEPHGPALFEPHGPALFEQRFEPHAPAQPGPMGPVPAGVSGGGPVPVGPQGSGPLPAMTYGPGSPSAGYAGGGAETGMPASISGPLPGGMPPVAPASDLAPTTGPVPGMPLTDQYQGAPLPGPNGSVAPRPGSGSPNGGPIHGMPHTGGIPDNRPTSDIQIPS